MQDAPAAALAVVGMAYRFPGGVDGPDAFWELLSQGEDAAVTEIPRDRWDVDAYFDPDPNAAPGKMYTRYGAFIDGLDRFDAQFFGVSAAEADAMDPQQRILLEVCYCALHNAGYSKETLRDKDVGVFVGAWSCDFSRLSQEQIGPYFITGTSHSMLANRISFALGLRGPSISIDTASSSSLVTVHLASKLLRAGDCSLAVVAGVNLMLHPDSYLATCQMRILSPDGRCKPFDTSANGYVRGEGCGAVVLKRACDAERDGNPVLALLRGTAVNHEGWRAVVLKRELDGTQDVTLTAPSSEFQQKELYRSLADPQQEVLYRALADAGVSANQVDYLEAHGTGTPLGDRVELDALKAVFAPGRDASHPLVLGSVKALIGHLEGAAGIAGFIKAVLVLYHRVAPRLPHLRNPVDLEGLPLVLPQENVALTREKTLIAGVSSFGLGGTNAHVVLSGVSERSHAGLGISCGSLFEHQIHLWKQQPQASAALAPAAFMHLGAMRELVMQVAREVARVPVLDAEAPLMQAGVDSMAALELQSRLSRRLAGLVGSLPKTLLLDYPTVNAIAVYLMQRSEDAGREVVTPGSSSIESMLGVVMEAAEQACGSPVHGDAPLLESGLDSVGAVEFRTMLSRRLGGAVPLPTALLLDYPTVNAIAAYVHSRGQQPRAPSDGGCGAPKSLAVIGMACRLPGRSSSPAAFWEMLVEGREGIVDVPRDRWGEVDCCVRKGGFIDDVKLFDAAFFGIPDAEAAVMDPQQRLMLEVGYEAFFRAGESKSSLLRSRTGVFVGIMTHDWSIMSATKAVSVYTGTGTASSIVANRLSYVLGLEGPSMSIDTACSSSLVALDVACQNLRRGVCNMALVAGVNLMLHPSASIAFCKARMLSPDACCKTFDASANGYVRGEGCAAVVLKRASEATRVLAMVRGSAVNQDGRSASLMAPNGPSQQKVITLALQEAQVAPTDVEYVETHGTGTALGDPVEVGALRAVYGVGRTMDQPLVLGAVKTNIGHLEAAAGMAGLVKVVLVLLHRQVPPNLHLLKVNPHLDLEGFPVTFPKDCTPLGRYRGSRGRVIAGLSSFGFGGTNAHVVVEEAELGCVAPALLKKVAFLFTGQGSQYVGMGRELYEKEAVFRDTIDRCDAVLRQLRGWSLLAILYPSSLDDTSLIHETEYAQPALFAFEYALAILWRSRGVDPVAVLGHSVGEYVAACVAGAFSLEGGLQLIAERGRLMQALPKQDGCMMAVPLEEERVRSVLQRTAVVGRGSVSIAAVNGPKSLVLSGRKAAVHALLSELQVQGHPLTVSHAFHSPLMAPVAVKLREVVDGMRIQGPTQTQIPVVTNATGGVVSGADLRSGKHWAEHLMRTVRFMDGMERLRELGCDVLVEVGPEPILVHIGRRFLLNTVGLTWVASCERRKDACETFSAAVTQVHTASSSSSSSSSLVLGPVSIYERKAFPWTDECQSAAATPVKGSEPAVYEVAWEKIFSPPIGSRAVTRLLVMGAGADEVMLMKTDVSVTVIKPGASGAEVKKVLQSKQWSLVLVLPLALDVSTVLTITHSILSLETAGRPRRLVFVRCGVRIALSEEAVRQHGWLSGFVKTLRLEHNELQTCVIDVEAGTEALALCLRHLIAGTVALPADEAEVVLNKDGGIHVPRLVPSKVTINDETARFAARNDATYLITGGLGALGLVFAAWLVETGARHLVLVSRGGVEAAQTELQALRESGARVEAMACDVSDMKSVQTMLSVIDKSLPPLRGVIHAAGVLGDVVPIERRGVERFKQVFAGKVDGAWNLHMATLEQCVELDFFVLFSSMSSLLGLWGHSSYAAANAALDALGRFRRSQGVPALTIQWGAWRSSTGGMTVSNKAMKRLEQQGVGVSSEVGVRALNSLLSYKGLATEAAVVSVEGLKLMYRVNGWRQPLLSHLLPQTDTSKTGTGSEWLFMVPEDARLEEMRKLVMETVKEVSSLRKVDVSVPLMKLGLDSLGAVELQSRLSWRLGGGIELPTTLVLDHPTVDTIAAYLVQLVWKDEPASHRSWNAVIGRLLRKVFRRKSLMRCPSLGMSVDEIVMDRATATKWLVPLASSENGRSKARLLTFPGAGGLSRIYTKFQVPGVDIVIVFLPGRDGREDEPELSSIRAISRHVVKAAEVLGYLGSDAPRLSLLGYSLGALTALETAHQLKALHGFSVDKLFVACAKAPHIWVPAFWIHEITVCNYAIFRYLWGFPMSWKYAGYMSRDLIMMDEYACRRDQYLDCPIIAIYGSLDRLTPMQRHVLGFSIYTSREVTVKVINGGDHFWIMDWSYVSQFVHFLRHTIKD